MRGTRGSSRDGQRDPPASPSPTSPRSGRRTRLGRSVMPSRLDESRACSRCGVEFRPRVSNVKAGWGKFCSHSCASATQQNRTGDRQEKICPSCGETKPIDGFYQRGAKTPRPASRCKQCDHKRRLDQRHRAREDGRLDGVRSVLESNKRWAKRNPERVHLLSRAGAITRQAIKEGHLTKSAFCESCNSTGIAIEAAHEDYSRPLDVLWLCRPCHRRWDRAEPKTLTGVSS